MSPGRDLHLQIPLSGLQFSVWTRIEATARSDFSILIAARHVREDIPALAEKLMEGQPHQAHGEGPSVPGFIRDGKFKVKPTRLDDGSLVLPADESPRAIAKMLERDGLERTAIEEALAALEAMPENEKATIAPDLDVIKWSFSRIEPDPSLSATLDRRVPLKIAFEFLALCLGRVIYAPNLALSHLRSSLLNKGEWDESAVSVDRLHAPQYAPFHGICNDPNGEYSKVQIRLFGRLAYRVHFHKLHIDGPRFVYTHLLNNNAEDLRIAA